MSYDAALNNMNLPKSRLFPALAVVLLCLAGTAGTALFAQKEIADREVSLFDGILNGLGVRTNRIVESYEQRLLGLAGFVAGSDEITLQDWSNYIAAIQSQDLAPAIWDVGLFDVVPKNTTPDDSTDATPTKEAEQAVVTRYVTLVSGRTIQSSGRDLLLDPETGPAIRRAMATGEASLSHVIRNAYQSDVKAGYALVAPVATIKPQDNLPPSALVFLSFSTDQLLTAVMRDVGFPVCVDLYDGDSLLPEDLVSQYCQSGVTKKQAFYEKARTIVVGGHTLTLCLTAAQGFYISPLAVPVGIIIPLGLVITALVGGLLWIEAATRGRALALAKSMTTDLEQSRNRYDRAVRVAGVGFWERDYLTNKVLWSDKMWELTGVDPATALTGRNIVLELTHPDDRKKTYAASEAHFKHGEPFSEEFRLLRADGTTIWITTTVNTERNSDGKPVRTTGSVSDITLRKNEETARQMKEQELTETIFELRQSQEKLDTALRDAEAASRAKSIFLSTMSHELRTPLNAILGFSEVIRDNLLGRGSTRSYEDYAADIHSSGEHLLDLINDILDLAKVEEGQITLNPEDLVLNTVVENTLNLMQPRAISKQQALSAKFPGEPITVHADLRAMKQILFNLIANAIQFTDTGGKIEVAAARTDEGAVEICVSDTGMGIAKADIGRIFNPFERVIEPGKIQTEGTGLGLAVVKSLVELHHGTLRVDSKPGQGSTFCVASPPRTRSARKLNWYIFHQGF
jgi:PAS domain S-box-containing protein